MKRARSSIRGAVALLVASLYLFGPASVAATCYRLDGTPFAKIRADDGDWIACDASATVSSCCSTKDYCLGNGLCLDAGANNYFSVQGCTDQAWGKPCITNSACKGNIRDGYSFIWPCGQVTNSTYNYCCGTSPSCCSNTSSLIIVPAVTSIDRPSPATVTPITATVTIAASPGSSGPDGKILAIGLGAGLGTGLLLLGAILLCVVYQLRKKSRQAQHGPAGGRSTSATMRTSSRLGLGADDEDKNRNQDPAPASSMPMGAMPLPANHHSPANINTPPPVGQRHPSYQQQQQQQQQQPGFAPTRYPELESHQIHGHGGGGASSSSPTAQWDNSRGYDGYEAQQQQQQQHHQQMNTSPSGSGAWYGGSSPNSHP